MRHSTNKTYSSLSYTHMPMNESVANYINVY